MTGPYELRFDYDSYMQPENKTELEAARAKGFKAIEDVARDWLQAHPTARPRTRPSGVAGVPCGNADMERLSEYVHSSLPDEVDVTGAMIKAVLDKVARERDQQLRAIPWWRRSGPVWFWLAFAGLVILWLGLIALVAIKRL